MTKRGPVSQLRDLLLWARKEKIVLSTVTLGDLHVEIARDHGMRLTDAPPPTERRRGIYEQYAGVLIQEDSAQPGSLETLVEDEE